MPVITRSDGVQFAVYTYRELLTVKKASLLKQEIEMLRRENGDYCRFFSLPSGDYEAVFAREDGYLLAESVWEHFGKPDDLLYCEQLADSDEALLVVVRAGSVYLDAKIPGANLIDEFSSLLAGTNQYDIYVYGDVPLAEIPSDDHFAFASERVKSFTQLEQSVFEQLQPDSDYQLIPVKEALDELQLGRGKIPLYAVVIILLAALGVAYWMLQPKTEEPMVRTVVKAKPRDPYLEYKRALQYPSPQALIHDIADDLRQLLTMPGWSPVRATYSGDTLIADLESIGGSTEILLAWVKTNRANLKVNEGKASINIPVDMTKRPPPTVIYNIRGLVSVVYDRLKLTVPTGAISISGTEADQNFVRTQMNLTFNNVSIDILELYGEQLDHLPIVVEAIALAINEGLISGNIQFDVIGAQAS